MATKCRIHDCTQPACWHVTTTGHPNGDLNAWYCGSHVPLPAWNDSPTPYEIRIVGPENGTKKP